MASGGITLSVFFLYLRSMGWTISIICVVLMVCNRLAEVGSNFWLSHWTESLRPKFGIRNCSEANQSMGELIYKFYMLPNYSDSNGDNDIDINNDNGHENNDDEDDNNNDMSCVM